MSNIVDYKNVSMVGLESSPVAETLAGLRANEARFGAAFVLTGVYVGTHPKILRKKLIAEESSFNKLSS